MFRKVNGLGVWDMSKWVVADNALKIGWRQVVQALE